MSKHPIFCSILQQRHDNHRFSTDPFCALAEFKVLLHKAKKVTKRELSRQTPDCIGQCFQSPLLLCVLIEIDILGHSCGVVKLGNLLKTALIYSPFECIDFQRLSQIIPNLTRETLAEREAEITNLP